MGGSDLSGSVKIAARPNNPLEPTAQPRALVQDQEITRGIYQRFDGRLALNCFVIEGGEIAVGGEVRLVRGVQAEAEQILPRLEF